MIVSNYLKDPSEQGGTVDAMADGFVDERLFAASHRIICKIKYDILIIHTF